MVLKIACATDDGINFISRHFGDAKKYLIFVYDDNSKKFIFQEEVENKPFKEKHDGDPKKANFISNILKPKGINILMNKALGPNIVRMRQKFAIVISRIDNIEEALSKIDINFIINELKKEEGIDKEILYVK